MSEQLIKPDEEQVEYAFQDEQSSEVNFDDDKVSNLEEKSPYNDLDNSDDDSSDEEDADLIIKREARRVDRQQKKQLKKRIISEKDQRIQRLEQEVNEARQQREQLQQSLGYYNQKFQEYDSLAKQFQQSSIDRELQETKQLKDYYNQQLAQAVAVADGTTWQAVNSKLDEIKLKEYQLSQQRMNADLQARQAQAQPSYVPQQQSAPVDPIVKMYLEEFAEDHPWVTDPKYKSESRKAKLIDHQIFAQGYKPNTREYWDELNFRLKEEMPYLFDEEAPAPKSGNGSNRAVRGTSSAGGANMNTGSNGKKRFVLEPHHKNTLIQLGYLGEDGKKVLNKEKMEKFVRGIYEVKARNTRGEW